MAKKSDPQIQIKFLDGYNDRIIHFPCMSSPPPEIIPFRGLTFECYQIAPEIIAKHKVILL